MLASTALLLVATLAPALFVPTQAAQENDPEIQEALASMNQYRRWLGLDQMAINPALQAAAEAHANYYRQNYGDPNLAGMGLHMETPGMPGFTGATMRDRARAQGYEGSVNENVGLSGSMIWSLEWFMNTINHRLPIIDPRYTDVGMATVDDGDIVFEVIMFGMPEYSNNGDPEWVVWPPDGTTGVGLSFWGESPNPFPGATFPTGLPITMSYLGDGGISLSSWSIHANGEELASFGSVGTGFLSGRAALITASAPLEYGTTYTVSASGTAGDEPYARTWSFTTKIDDSDSLARGGDEVPEEGAAPTPELTATPEPSPEPTAAPADTAAVEIAPAAPPFEDADPDLPMPPGLQFSPEGVQALWTALDGAVHDEREIRSWILGTDVWAAGEEAYAEEPAGARDVYYFDKARVEAGEAHELEDLGSLTAGLLVRDMILGEAQVGDETFLEIGPAEIPLAGDPLEFNENAPTYASLYSVASVDGDDNRAEARFGAFIVDTLYHDGTTGKNEQLSGVASYGSYHPATGHNVAAVFEDYFETLPIAWWEITGLPITEPYWTRVMVREQPRWVLVQAFERRLLTYTPDNAPDWQVEMGNVGRHYYEWRYGIEPPATAPPRQPRG